MAKLEEKSKCCGIFTSSSHTKHEKHSCNDDLFFHPIHPVNTWQKRKVFLRSQARIPITAKETVYVKFQ
jgi:hypothetical protein